MIDASLEILSKCMKPKVTKLEFLGYWADVLRSKCVVQLIMNFRYTSCTPLPFYSSYFDFIYFKFKLNKIKDKSSYTMLLGFKAKPSQYSLSRAFLGSTFKDEPVSTRTWAKLVPLHSTETCNALLCFFPLGVKSASEKPNPLSTVKLVSPPLNH